MANEEKLNQLQKELRSYCNGVNQFLYNPLFKTIQYSDGVKYFMENAGQGAYWFLTLVATEIKPTIPSDDFYFIELKVNEDESAVITCQRDKGEPVLYKKELKYTDCPYSEEPYKFYFDYYPEQQTLILPSEY